MKVVLFCGGMGTRLRDYSDKIPKPMVPIGYRPILWHIMKYYAHFGHKDFILCLGYKADMFKNYFVNYDEYLSNDFVYERGGENIRLLNSDIHDWRITFVDTGMHANIGERLRAVRPFLEGEEVFLANYTDIVSDLYLPDMIDHFYQHDAVGSFLAVQPNYTFHVVKVRGDHHVEEIAIVNKTSFLINGGFFIFRKSIFDYMEAGNELVEEPFQRLIQIKKLIAYKYTGFWAPMDTFKDKMRLDDLYSQGNTPWKVWEHQQPESISTFEPKARRAGIT